MNVFGIANEHRERPERKAMLAEAKKREDHRRSHRHDFRDGDVCNGCDKLRSER